MKSDGAKYLKRTESSKKLGPDASIRKYKNGEVIYSQGEDAEAMFRVEMGYVKLAVSSHRNAKTAITILRAGDYFGQGCLQRHTLRKATATSIKESVVARISRPAMMLRLDEEPAFAKAFIDHLLKRIAQVEADLADQQLNSSERRLARLLMQLSDFDALRRGGPPVANVDQGTLAQVVGTTRSRVSHFMNGFRNKGFIDYNGDLHVHEALSSFLLE
jgi:CRP/FNR family transcriptional regulator, cyclic AMP receptor protein